MKPAERLKEIENDYLHADTECNLGKEDHTWLINRVKLLTEALEVYAMTNETFPEYGDVARKALGEE